MPHRFLPWAWAVVLAAGCGASGGNASPDDMVTTPDVVVADLAASDPDDVLAPDPAASDLSLDFARPTCCTDALCAPLGARCDAGTCRCVPGDACCDPTVCGAVGMVCDPGTCRCARVPCDTEGAACDPGAVAGDIGRVACTRTEVGLFCLRRVGDWDACPGSYCQDWDGLACTCGWKGCTPFENLCGDGLACVPQGWDPAPSAICAVPGVLGEGEACTGVDACTKGLYCNDSRCVKVDCGIGPGAPACPAGKTCRPLENFGIFGHCRVPCDPFDPDGPCGADEWCAAPCSGEQSAPWCGTNAAPPYGVLGGWCVTSRDGPPAAGGGACSSTPCVQGYICNGERCREACPPGLPSATGVAACPAGLECASVQGQWPASTGGVCATPCDPFLPAGDPVCEGSLTCILSPVASPSLGYCGVWPSYGSDLGTVCWPYVGACPARQVCGLAGPGRQGRCMLPCRVGAAPGESGGCEAGTRCFRNYDDVSGAWAPWGHCAAPCDPWSAGACPAATTCVPLDRDAATGRLVGVCLAGDTGAEGQPCTSPSPFQWPGCAPGLTCRPESGGPRCRPTCDVLSSRSGQGACPPGERCERAWPPTGDPVLGGCVEIR